VLAVTLLATGAATAGSTASPLATPQRLQTAVLDGVFLDPSSVEEFKRVSAAGASSVRLLLQWNQVAPARPTPEFRPSDPADQAYDWSAFDQQVAGALAHGLEPFVDVLGAPAWARERPSQGGPYKPDPGKLAAFTTAAVRRYSGTFQDFPRIKYWQLWSEPNLAVQLRPQFLGSNLYSPYWYRKVLNAFAAAVHSVHASNLVIAGGTAPFTSRAGARASWGPGPLLFLREFLCLSKELRPTCNDRAHFDIWAHHPYTSGGPSHKANISDDVSLGDLPRMRATLDAAVKAGKVVSDRRIEFWVTEFSWDTNPPDPHAMPITLQARWVSEALYTMWRSGVSLVTWFLVRDHPLSLPWQSGLYFRGGSPKPSLLAFRFPFVAFQRDNEVEIWGRTPPDMDGRVIIEHKVDGAWRTLGSVQSNAHGLFAHRYRGSLQGSLRARLPAHDETSRPFSLEEPPDRFYRPFGEAGRGGG
jgi:hypothetical protein